MESTFRGAFFMLVWKYNTVITVFSEILCYIWKSKPLNR